ncbi:hypothetical protein HUK65_17480 [Rhodobacteraceae bacterium 2376]|uniref:Uncharacterized protein n=1 Tax=Rhabdonatronobacter sediminivivens TaxID=2743469 RepID=A0A7Z0KZJ5_9RHOB|nr:hypothetical protein [Rhabdonatronobacter sediminivivens]NYS26767.1 hypothetical protein [Rhabdonatronobacter sediminivivens]
MRPRLELTHCQYQSTRESAPKRSSSSARTAWLACTESDVERLDAKAAESMSCYPLERARVLLIGFEADELCDISHGLCTIGVDATDSISNVDHLHKASEYLLGFTHILVNIDAFEDVESAVDVLLAYRSNAPFMVIVACSYMVGGDDFGRERTAICDATLKMPISTSRLAKGLSSAELAVSANRCCSLFALERQ